MKENIYEKCISLTASDFKISNKECRKIIKKSYNKEIENNTDSHKTKKMGKIFIASMNMRGTRADAPDGAIKLNVTSCQATLNPNRIHFSPFSNTGYKGFHCFENYWQSKKVFEGIPYEVSLKWWKGLKEAKRRYPNSKGKKVLGTVEGYDYVTSRKKIYVPEYYNLVKDYDHTKDWIEKFKKCNIDICVYDFDGPRTDTGGVTCSEVTLDFLREKINDTRFPFGHGYVVSAMLLGIDPEEYC